MTTKRKDLNSYSTLGESLEIYYSAQYYGAHEDIEKELEKNPSLLEKQWGIHKSTILHSAAMCEKDSIENVETILGVAEKQNVPIKKLLSIRNQDGLTPTHEAFKSGNIEIAEFLILKERESK